MVTVRPLSGDEVAEIRQNFQEGLRRDGIVTFIFVGIFGACLAATVLRFGIGKEHATVVTVTTLGGVFGCAGVSMMYWAVRKDISAVWADLRSMQYEEWTVSPDRIVEVVPDGSWDAIAVDCGESSIVLIGGWWRYENRSQVKWTGAGKRGFPSSRFTLKVLPKSGRVIGVNVAGRKLKIDKLPEGGGDTRPTPILTVKHFGYEQCRYHQMPLSEIVDWKTPEVK